MRSEPWRRRLVVMVKEPRAGRVKTRLGREIGMTSAARWFHGQTLDLLRRVQDQRWETLIATTPDYEGMISRCWPASIARLPQGGQDLGARMARLFRFLPPGPLCIIGSDIPHIERRHVAAAFRALGRHNAVFGPAMDGGYWLIGLKRRAPPPRGLFAGVRWSTPYALADTLKSVPGPTAQIARLRDVDTLADLAALGNRRIARLCAPASRPR